MHIVLCSGNHLKIVAGLEFMKNSVNHLVVMMVSPERGDRQAMREK